MEFLWVYVCFQKWGEKRKITQHALLSSTPRDDTTNTTKMEKRLILTHAHKKYPQPELQQKTSPPDTTSVGPLWPFGALFFKVTLVRARLFGASISSYRDVPCPSASAWNIKQQWNWTGALNCFEQMLCAFKCWIIHFGSMSLSLLMPWLNAAGISLPRYHFS